MRKSRTATSQSCRARHISTCLLSGARRWQRSWNTSPTSRTPSYTSVFLSGADQASLVGATSGALVQHNLFLNLWAETGAIGLFLTVLVFVLLFGQSRQLYKKLPPNAVGDVSRDFVVLFWVILANYLSDAMFRDPLWDVFSNAMLWSLAGFVVCFNRLLEPQPLDLPIAAPGWQH